MGTQKLGVNQAYWVSLFSPNVGQGITKPVNSWSGITYNRPHQDNADVESSPWSYGTIASRNGIVKGGVVRVTANSLNEDAVWSLDRYPVIEDETDFAESNTYKTVANGYPAIYPIAMTSVTIPAGATGCFYTQITSEASRTFQTFDVLYSHWFVDSNSSAHYLTAKDIMIGIEWELGDSYSNNAL